jgi:hypothetical protein
MSGDTIIPFDEFDVMETETPDYSFLKHLYNFINRKSYPKKNTRKFMKEAIDLVKKGEIDKDVFLFFIENEGLNKKIVDDIKSRNKSFFGLSGNDRGNDRVLSNDNDYDSRRVSDPCGTSSSDPCSSSFGYRSSC